MSRLRFAAGLASALALLATLASPFPAAAADEIKIGVGAPTSGDLASYGIPTVRAAELVVKEINAAGGILGKQVRLFVEDDVCKPEVATNVSTKLVSQGVSAVIGHICSGATKAALPAYKEAKIPAVSPSATNTALTQSGDWPNFFRTIAYDQLQAKKDVDFALNVLKLKKLAVLHDKGDYGKGLAEDAKNFLEQAAKKDNTVQVVLFEGITPGQMDYSAIVQKVKDSGAEGIIYGGYHPEASKIVMQMRKKGMKTFFISDDGVKDDTFIKTAGEYAEGVYATGPQDMSANALYQKAVEAHKKAYNAEPGAFYKEAWAATMAVLNAIKKAGSTDYDKVIKVLRTEYVETPVGKIRFDPKGDAEGVDFAVYQVQKGKYVVVK